MSQRNELSQEKDLQSEVSIPNSELVDSKKAWHTLRKDIINESLIKHLKPGDIWNCCRASSHFFRNVSPETREAARLKMTIRPAGILYAADKKRVSLPDLNCVLTGHPALIKDVMSTYCKNAKKVIKSDASSVSVAFHHAAEIPKMNVFRILLKMQIFSNESNIYDDKDLPDTQIVISLLDAKKLNTEEHFDVCSLAFHRKLRQLNSGRNTPAQRYLNVILLDGIETVDNGPLSIETLLTAINPDPQFLPYASARLTHCNYDTYIYPVNFKDKANVNNRLDMIITECLRKKLVDAPAKSDLKSFLRF